MLRAYIRITDGTYQKKTVWFKGSAWQGKARGPGVPVAGGPVVERPEGGGARWPLADAKHSRGTVSKTKEDMKR